jgi:radical SAM superfamily enzyme YgiQ (UPF0313 family)
MTPPVLLIIPPAPYLISDRAFPPLGILYVASDLQSRGVGVELCDLSGLKDWRKKLRAELESVKPDFAGVTATSPDLPAALAILGECRKARPKMRVIIGGVHATICPSDCSDFDHVISGDGWGAVELAMRPDAPKFISVPPSDFDAIPFPARHLLDMDSYHFYLEGRPAASIMSHLGCPFSCVFCTGRNHDYFRRVRFRSAAKVLEEMDLVAQTYGRDAFVFYDDEFNLDRKHVLDICALLETRGYVWRAPVRADLLDMELASAMRSSGCVEVSVGVESGSARVLEKIGKGVTPEQNTAARDICRRAGIRFKAFTVVGLPGATRADEDATKNWLLDNKPDDFDIAINTPYPGTRQYNFPADMGLSFSCDFKKDVVSYKVAPGKYKGFASNGTLSAQEMVALRDAMDRELRRRLKIPPPGHASSLGAVDHSKGGAAPAVARGILRAVKKRVKSIFQPRQQE